MTTDGLDSFLEKFQAPVESEGSFSVSVANARHKLQKFQLQNPRRYCIELVAVAVLGRATYFSVSTTKREVRFSFDGQPFSAQELQDIEAHAHLGAGCRRLQRLAVALGALCSLAPSRVELRCESQHGAIIWTRSGRKPKVEINQEPGKFASAQVSLRVVQKSSLLSGSQALGESEIDRLLACCCHAPLHLAVNKRPIIVPTQAYHLCLKLTRPDVHLATPWARRVSDASSADFSRVPFSALLLVAHPNEAGFGLRVVLEGVGFDRDPSHLGNRFLHALVTAPRLKTDLSHANIVVNSDYLELMEHLQERGQALILEYTRQCGHRSLPPYWAQAVSETRAYYHAKGERGIVEELTRWLQEENELVEKRKQAERERLEEMIAKGKRREQEAKLRMQIKYPSREDLRLVASLQQRGRQREALQLQKRFAQYLAQDLSETFDRREAEELARRSLQSLQKHKLLPAFQSVLKPYTAISVNLPLYQKALLRHQPEKAVELARELSDLEILADCLDLVGDRNSRREAVHLRLQALGNSTDLCLRHLRLDLIRRRSRGITSLTQWAKIHVRAVWAARLARRTHAWQALHSTVRSIALGGRPGSLALNELLTLNRVQGLSKELVEFLRNRALVEYLRHADEHSAHLLCHNLAFYRQTKSLRTDLKTTAALL